MPGVGAEPEAAGPATCLVRDAVKGDGFSSSILVPLADSPKGFLFSTMEQGGVLARTPVLWTVDASGPRALATLCSDCAVALAARTADAVWFWADGLWRSDGTSAGTWRVPSLLKPALSEGKSAAAVVGDRLYTVDCLDEFSDECRVWSLDSRSKAWQKDWTLQVGESYGDSVEVVALDGELYALTHSSLWRLTPKSRQAQLIWREDNGSYSGYYLSVLGQRVLWRNESQLWSYEPRAGRLTLLSSNQSGLELKSGFKTIGNRAYLLADDGTTGDEIWSTDGTVAGTRRETDFTDPQPYGYRPEVPVVGVGANVVFPLYEDGLPVGFFALAGPGKPLRLLHRRCDDCDALPNTPPFLQPSGEMVAAGKGALFIGGEAETGFEPWITDGTVAGTRLAHDVCPGRCSTNVTALESGAVGGLFLTSHLVDRTWSSATWASDGTSANTRRIGPAAVVPSTYVPSPFAAWDVRTKRYVYPALLPQPGLYAADPKVADGAKALATTRREQKGIHPRYLLPFPGGLVFERGTDLPGVSSWWTVSGSPPRLSAFTGGGRSCFGNCGYPFGAVADGFVFFRNKQLWRSDGTSVGTMSLTDEPGGLPLPNDAPPFLSWRGRSLFIVQNELWITDGSVAGTRHFELSDGPSGNHLRTLLDLGDELIFTVGGRPSAGEVAEGRSWRTDGTAEGTRRLEAPHHQAGSHICWMSKTGDKVVASTIRQASYENRFDVWALDLSTETWSPLGRLDGDSCQGAPAVFRDSAYFVRAGHPDDSYDEYIWRLWRVNPSASPLAVKAGDLVLANGDVFRHDLVSTEAGLWWSVSDSASASGRELWTSDGTAAGTKLLELFPGDYGSRPTDLTATPFGLFFAALGPFSGRDVWRVAPGSGKAPVVWDSAPGSLSSAPSEFTTVGNRVYFAGSRPDVGRELFFWSANGCKP